MNSQMAVGNHLCSDASLQQGALACTRLGVQHRQAALPDTVEQIFLCLPATVEYFRLIQTVRQKSLVRAVARQTLICQNRQTLHECTYPLCEHLAFQPARLCSFFRGCESALIDCLEGLVQIAACDIYVPPVVSNCSDRNVSACHSVAPSGERVQHRSMNKYTANSDFSA